MKRIVMLGQSAAGVKALEIIRAQDPEAQLTIVLLDENLPYRRELLADFVGQKLPEDKILYQPKDFYSNRRIELVSGKKIARVNLKKNQIVTEEKEIIPFDILLVAGTAQIKFPPEVKGTGKAGVFSLNGLTEIKNILSLLPVIETVILETQDREGIRLACALRERGKEVIVISPSEYILPTAADAQASSLLIKLAQENEVRFIAANNIVEILGEGEAKAVRLKSKKVLSGEIIIFTETLPDLRWFSDSLLEIKDRICISDEGRTNMENVFAINGTRPEVLGEKVAAAILSTEQKYSLPK